MASSKTQFTVGVLGLVSLVVCVACWVQPLNTPFYRGAFLLGAMGFVLCSVLFPKNLRGNLLALVLVGGLGAFVYQSKPSGMDQLEFEEVWLESVRQYEGAPYRFGGSSFVGMDSSGLIRRAMILTQIKLVHQNKNPYHLKVAYRVWSSSFSLASLLNMEQSGVEFVGYLSKGRQVPLRKGDILIGQNMSDAGVYLGGREVLGFSSSTRNLEIHELGSRELLMFSSWVYVLRWNYHKTTTSFPEVN